MGTCNCVPHSDEQQFVPYYESFPKNEKGVQESSLNCTQMLKNEESVQALVRGYLVRRKLAKKFKIK